MSALLIGAAAALGGGAGVGVLLTIRQQRRKVSAEAKKIEAEADAMVSAEWHKFADDLRVEMQRREAEANREIGALKQRINEIADLEAACRTKLNIAEQNVAEMQAQMTRAQVEAKTARTEVIALEDRIDRLERNGGRRREDVLEEARSAARSTVSEFIEQIGGME